MANAIVQHITKESIGKAIAQARIECATSRRWLNAVNRAAVELLVSHWQFDGETLRIESATTPGTRYTVDEKGCNCSAAKADKPCKHRAAWRLLIKAAEIHAHAAALKSTPASWMRLLSCANCQ
jgi:hypothetical protein